MIAVVFTILVHVWRRNLMWSIVVGTVCYMALIRVPGLLANTT
ncbi:MULTISPECIES: AzlD domain-containing protein [Prevotellaceae]|nr:MULTISPECIES: AzlD domain-containing protein [Prevotellaceae]MCI7371639.1 AzlD domain-containing protein [Prevotella sp.]MDD6197938.1 AzlD domain-containing protein [Prevotella sp.]MDY4645601.1 AzlD domain-containing protein [Prevotella sp.]